MELSEGLNRVLRTLPGDPPLPTLQTPSAGHCLDTHGVCVLCLLFFGEAFLLSVGAFKFCLQLSFFAYSPLRPLVDALSHCKQKSSNCKQERLINFWAVSVLISVSDSVKRHLRGRHLSVLNLKFDFISDGGRTREEQIALSLKRHLFPHGGREPKAFWICFSRVHPPSEIKSNFKFKALRRHLLKRHLTLSDRSIGKKAPKPHIFFSKSALP